MAQVERRKEWFILGPMLAVQREIRIASAPISSRVSNVDVPQVCANSYVRNDSFLLQEFLRQQKDLQMVMWPLGVLDLIMYRRMRLCAEIFMPTSNVALLDVENVNTIQVFSAFSVSHKYDNGKFPSESTQ